MSKSEQDVRRKLRVFEYAERIGNISKTCRHFGMPRSLFYAWRNAYRCEGVCVSCHQEIPAASLTVDDGPTRFL